MYILRATSSDKSLVVNILSQAFIDNKSVNAAIKQDNRKIQRIKKLMEYSFDICQLYGEILLSENKEACALILLVENQKTTFKRIFLVIKLIFFSVGIANIFKIMNHQSKINAMHPTKPFIHLWYIAVTPNSQNHGVGSFLLTKIIKQGQLKKRPIYLETSTLKNIPWYKKFGFEIFGEIDFGYKLFFLKRNHEDL